MKDPSGTNSELAEEISVLKQRIKELQQSELHHKREEEALRESEERFRAIADYTYDWESWIGPDGKLLWLNPGVLLFTGYSVNECMAMNDFPMPLFYEPDSERMIRTFRDVVQGASCQNVEFRIQCKDGSLKWGWVSCQPIYNAHGTNLGHRSSIRDITDRKQAESQREAALEELRENEIRYRELFENMGSGVAVYERRNNGEDFVFKEYNSAAEIINETPRGQVIGRSVVDVFPGVKDFGLFDVFQRVYRTGKPERHPVTFYNDEKISGWRENYVYKLPSGEIVAVFEDITDRKRLESQREAALEELRKSESRYRFLFDAVPVGIAVTDPKGVIYAANQGHQEITGYTPEDLKTIKNTDIYADLTERRQMLQILRESGRVRDYEVRIRRKDGALRSVLLNVNQIEYAGGEAFLTAMRDITDHKQAESQREAALEALRESEERYYVAIEASNDGVAIVRNHAHIYVNKAFLLMFGYDSLDEMTGKHEYCIVHPDDYELVTGHASVRQKGDDAPTRYEFKGIRRDGRPIDVEVSVNTVLYQGEHVILAYLRDITERKQAQEALQENEAKYRSLSNMLRLMCDNVPDMIWAKGLDKRYIFANRAICRGLLNARDAYEPIGENDMFFAERERKLHPDEPGWHTFGEICADSDAIVIESRQTKHFDEYGNVKGRFLFLDVHKAPFWDGLGNLIGTVGCGRDITDRKLAEEALRASLYEKDFLIREIHHRVKNNMQVMSGLLDLQASSTGNPELTEILNESQRRIRAMALVHEKLYDSKDFTRIDLGDYVRALSRELIQAYITSPGKIDLILQTHDTAYVDIGKANPCGLILNELISNALKHAFPGDKPGTLEIIIGETRNREIEISVRDNGVGLPDDVDIHQPRSVGFYLVNGLVKKQLDGQIEVIREGGTEFRITFPLLFVETGG